MPGQRTISASESVGLNVVIVPPSISDQTPKVEDQGVSNWLWSEHQRGCVLASACAGAFLLGAAGVLDGRPATTHWALADELKARYPEIDLQPEKMLVDDDDIITAGGLMAWMDLAIRLVQRFAGPTLVMELSKFLIVDTGQREQRFYQAFYPRLDHGDNRILQLQHWLQGHYAEPLSLATLASHANLSERSLQRRFTKATSVQPSLYLQELRIQKARELLETTRVGIDQIAWQVGYQDQSAFRRRFKKKIGLSPSQYRKRFQSELTAE
jgi:transcriptional regulator GlxA family with amidase domain